jgi:hypothetical protein
MPEASFGTVVHRMRLTIDLMELGPEIRTPFIIFSAPIIIKNVCLWWQYETMISPIHFTWWKAIMVEIDDYTIGYPSP